MVNTRILFSWSPTKFDYTLEQQFRERLLLEGIDPYWVEVRSPESNKAFVSDSLNWHRDSVRAESKFVIWASVRPTRVRFNDGSLLDGTQDGDAILIQEIEAEHQAPLDQENRWTIRACVS